MTVPKATRKTSSNPSYAVHDLVDPHAPQAAEKADEWSRPNQKPACKADEWSRLCCPTNDPRVCADPLRRWNVGRIGSYASTQNVWFNASDTGLWEGGQESHTIMQGSTDRVQLLGKSDGAHGIVIESYAINVFAAKGRD
jgi:hypothetical protein